MLGRHALRAPERRDLQITRLAGFEGLVRGDLVAEALRNATQVLNRVVVRLALFLLVEQSERLLPNLGITTQRELAEAQERAVRAHGTSQDMET